MHGIATDARHNDLRDGVVGFFTTLVHQAAADLRPGPGMARPRTRNGAIDRIRDDIGMASTERTYDRARLRATRATSRLGAEIRTARLAAGRSQRDIAAAARVSQSLLARIERGEHEHVSVDTLTIIGAMVGLDVVLNSYAGPRVIRDAPQGRLLGRLRDRLGAAWTWRYEVLVATGDQRAWDARVRHRRTGVEFLVEAETRIHDVQALLRRVALKREASGGVRVVLLVADTRHNRDAIRAARPMLSAEFPCTPRVALRALLVGEDPGSDALIVLGPDPDEPRAGG